MKKLIALLLTLLLLSVVGCGGADKKAEKNPTKPSVAQETTKPKDNSVFIIGTEVNAREKASIDSGIIGTYELGEKVTVIAEEGEWVKVKRSNGQECYVFKKYIGSQEDLDKRINNKNSNNIQSVTEVVAVKDVIKEARQRNGLINKTKQDTNYERKAKHSAKSSSGNPIYFCGDPNYILIYEQLREIPNKVEYVIRDSVEYKRSGNTVEIKLQTADIEDPKIEDPILIGIGGNRFIFNEDTGLAGLNFGKVSEFDYYERDPSLAYIPRSAALAYYIATGKKWPKFRYGNDFYSRVE